MNNIVVNNGHVVIKTDNYVLYKIATSDTQKYYMCLPTHEHESYQMVIDFPEEYYESLLETEMITEIKKICDVLFKSNANSLYILSNMTTYDLHEAQNENDIHAYATLLNGLKRCTSDAYNILKTGNDINISNVIGIVSQTGDDKKFMHYLETNMPGFFTNIDLNNSLSQELTNDATGFTTMDGPVNGGESMEHANNLSKQKVKKLLPPSKHGFINFTFIVVIISLSLVIGIGIAISLIR